MRHFLVAFLSLSVLHGSSQNLVLNPSFEEFTDCPLNDGLDHTFYATGWSKYCDTWCTPDYYNRCSPNDAFGIPESIFSFQEEANGNDAYMGLVTWGANVIDYREYIGAHLMNPTEVGVEYFASFKVVMSEFTSFSDVFAAPSNNIGLRLSTVEYNESNPCPVDNWSHLHEDSIISDTTNWITISGSFIADSSYSHIVLGNFFDDANTDTIFYNCPECLNYGAYYFIDDICVSTDSIDCLIDNVEISEFARTEKQLIRTINLVGNDIEESLNTLMIYIYSDGSTEKVFRVE